MPPPPPPLLSRAKRASNPQKLVETHHVSIIANGGGCAPPQPPRFFPSRAKRASIPMNLVEIHHVSIAVANGSPVFLSRAKGASGKGCFGQRVLRSL